MLTPKLHFRLGNEDHELWVEQGKNRNVVMMASAVGSEMENNEDARRVLEKDGELKNKKKAIENEKNEANVPSKLKVFKAKAEKASTGVSKVEVSSGKGKGNGKAKEASTDVSGAGKENNKGFPENYPIRAYRGKDLSGMDSIYIADIKLVVEMPFVGSDASNANSEGWMRDSQYYWQEIYKRYPSAFSEFNKDVIFGKNPDGLRAPSNDITFRKVFPQYDGSGLKGKKLVHHHIGGGGQAFGLPQPLHPGSGGIHNDEKQFGIWGADSKNAELLKKFL